MQDTAGSPERASSSILPARLANHSAGFDSSQVPAHGASYIISLC